MRVMAEYKSRMAEVLLVAEGDFACRRKDDVIVCPISSLRP